jgi:hypothetical protein
VAASYLSSVGASAGSAAVHDGTEEHSTSGTAYSTASTDVTAGSSVAAQGQQQQQQQQQEEKEKEEKDSQQWLQQQQDAEEQQQQQQYDAVEDAAACRVAVKPGVLDSFFSSWKIGGKGAPYCPGTSASGAATLWCLHHQLALTSGSTIGQALGEVRCITNKAPAPA